MSEVEHDPALVERVYAAILDPRNRYEGVPLAAIDAVRAWDAEHAEPSESDLIAELGGFNRIACRNAPGGTWAAVDDDSCARGTGATPRAALLALRDAVKGERHD